MSSAITAVVVGGAVAKRGADKAQHAMDASTTAQRLAEQQGAAQTREDFAPYREAGGRALGMLEQMMTGERDISESAGYQFRLDEGYKGLERSQIGRRLSGRAGKEMMRYGSDYASNEYQNEFSRLQSMANMGQASAAQQAQQTGASTARLSGIEGDYGANRAGLEQGRARDQQQNLSNLSTAWQGYNAPSIPTSNTPLHDQTSDLGW